MQLAELHSVLSPQSAPSGFLPQLPLRHVFPGAQSAGVAQVVLHAPAAQTYGAHDCI
jgi:hypothetical protein